MASPAETLSRLRADRDAGHLDALCERLGVDLLVVFGSVLTRPQTAGDVDLAYAHPHGRPISQLDVVNGLGEVYGDGLDLMPLDRAGSVARYAALGTGELLVQRTPEKFATEQLRAFAAYRDEQQFRDLFLEELLR